MSECEELQCIRYLRADVRGYLQTYVHTPTEIQQLNSARPSPHACN